MKKCPYCGDDIKSDANYCLSCLKSLNAKTVFTPPKIINKRIITLATSAVLCLVIVISGSFGIWALTKSPSDEIVQETVQNNVTYVTYTNENGEQQTVIVNQNNGDSAADDNSHNITDTSGEDSNNNSYGNYFYGWVNKNQNDNDFEDIVGSIDDNWVYTSNDNNSTTSSNNSSTSSGNTSSTSSGGTTATKNNLETQIFTLSDGISFKYVPVKYQSIAGFSRYETALLESVTEYIYNGLCFLPVYTNVDTYYIVKNDLPQKIQKYNNTQLRSTQTDMFNKYYDPNEYAFLYRSISLKKVVIPPNYTYVSTKTFLFNDITDIYIMGEKISIDPDWISGNGTNKVTIYAKPECLLVDQYNGSVYGKMSDVYKDLGVDYFKIWDGDINSIVIE